MPVEIVTANRDTPDGLQFFRITLSNNVKKDVMETIAFEHQKYRTWETSSLNRQDDVQVFLEDIVTIDSQIELKVRGELPEMKLKY
jgi:hypothetical protein